MAVVLHYLQFLLGRTLYPFRGHDSGQIIHTAAFKSIPKPNMTLESPECGPSGSSLLLRHTNLAEDGRGCLPELRWTPPQCDHSVEEYVLICEDIDLPIPFLVVYHGLQWAIPPSTTAVSQADVKPSESDPKSNMTEAGWRYVPNIMGASYIGAGPPLGHGSHRYVFTIIALNERLQFEHPEKASKKDIQNAMVGKIVGWGQWIGTFQRPWPNYTENESSLSSPPEKAR
jgi:Phospholipid-binding protein